MHKGVFESYILLFGSFAFFALILLWPVLFGGASTGFAVTEEDTTLPCGNNVCEPEQGEECDACASDCDLCYTPPPDHCGNEQCEPRYEESCNTCAQDCGPC